MLENSDRTGFAQGGLAVMPALEDTPELYRPAPTPDDPLTRHDARQEEAFILRAAAGATALTGRLRETPLEMSEGLVAEMLRRFDDESAALLDGAPSPATEDAARAAIVRARGRLADWALPQEALARTVALRTGLIEGLAQFREAAADDPDAVDALHAEGAAAIAGAADWLGSDEAAQLAEQWRWEIYQSSLEKLIQTDPDDALRRLSDERRAVPLDEMQRTALVAQAEERSRVLARDRTQSRDRMMQDADLRRQRERWEFRASFFKDLRDGVAGRRTLDDAERAGTITSADRAQLEARLTDRELDLRTAADHIAQVTDFLDARSDIQPSVEAIGAHYNAVMRPVIETTPSEDRGRLYLDYLRGLGRHDIFYEKGEVETGLPPPTDEPVNPRDIYEMLGYDPRRSEVSRALEMPIQGKVALVGAVEASRFTDDLFSGLPTHNNPADAFRHAYWNFLLTRGMAVLGGEGPKNAQKFADAHEAEHFKETLFGWLPEGLTGVRHWPEEERLMDIYNNAVGRSLAMLPENAGRPAHEVILQALEEGKLQTLPMNIEPVREK